MFNGPIFLFYFHYFVCGMIITSNVQWKASEYEEQLKSPNKSERSNLIQDVFVILSNTINKSLFHLNSEFISLSFYT